MMNSKVTYVSALDFVLSNTTLPAEIAEKITALRDAQVKRNSAERKPTKTQKENADLKQVVLSVLSETPCTVSELMQKHETLGALSNQKVSALVNALVREGSAVKVADKRVNKFAVA